MYPFLTLFTYVGMQQVITSTQTSKKLLTPDHQDP